MFTEANTFGYTTADMFRVIESAVDETSLEWHLKLILPRIKSMARKASDQTHTYPNQVRPGVRGYDDVVTELILAAMSAYDRYNPFLGVSFLTWSWQFLVNRLHEMVREDKTMTVSLDDCLCATIFDEEYLTLAELLVDEDDLAERVQATDNAIQFIKLIASGGVVGTRRKKVLTCLTQGLNQDEIGQTLNVNQSTVSRDIQFIRKCALDFATENKFSNWMLYIEMKAGDKSLEHGAILSRAGTIRS